MAKDKDQEVFVEPEFNQREFLKNEKDRAKATIVVFLLATGLGLLSGYLWIIGIWYVGVTIMLLLMVFFKRLLTALHLKVPEVTSHLFFLFMVFFLTWIIFWTVSLNPPLHTTAGPEVHELQYHFGNASFASAVETNGVYSITITQQNCMTHFKALVSFVAPLTNVTLTLNDQLYQSTYNSSSGWLYFDQSLSVSGTSGTYNYLVNVVIKGVSYNEPINIKVIKSS